MKKKIQISLTDLVLLKGEWTKMEKRDVLYFVSTFSQESTSEERISINLDVLLIYFWTNFFNQSIKYLKKIEKTSFLKF